MRQMLAPLKIRLMVADSRAPYATIAVISCARGAWREAQHSAPAPAVAVSL